MSSARTKLKGSDQATASSSAAGTPALLDVDVHGEKVWAMDRLTAAVTALYDTEKTPEMGRYALITLGHLLSTGQLSRRSVRTLLEQAPGSSPAHTPEAGASAHAASEGGDSASAFAQHLKKLRQDAEEPCSLLSLPVDVLLQVIDVLADKGLFGDLLSLALSNRSLDGVVRPKLSADERTVPRRLDHLKASAHGHGPDALAVEALAKLIRQASDDSTVKGRDGWSFDKRLSRKATVVLATLAVLPLSGQTGGHDRRLLEAIGAELATLPPEQAAPLVAPWANCIRRCVDAGQSAASHEMDLVLAQAEKAADLLKSMPPSDIVAPAGQILYAAEVAAPLGHQARSAAIRDRIQQHSLGEIARRLADKPAAERTPEDFAAAAEHLFLVPQGALGAARNQVLAALDDVTPEWLQAAPASFDMPQAVKRLLDSCMVHTPPQTMQLFDRLIGAGDPPAGIVSTWPHPWKTLTGAHCAAQLKDQPELSLDLLTIAWDVLEKMDPPATPAAVASFLTAMDKTFGHASVREEFGDEVDALQDSCRNHVAQMPDLDWGLVGKLADTLVRSDSDDLWNFQQLVDLLNQAVESRGEPPQPLGLARLLPKLDGEEDAPAQLVGVAEFVHRLEHPRHADDMRAYLGRSLRCQDIGPESEYTLQHFLGDMDLATRRFHPGMAPSETNADLAVDLYESAHWAGKLLDRSGLSEADRASAEDAVDTLRKAARELAPEVEPRNDYTDSEDGSIGSNSF